MNKKELSSRVAEVLRANNIRKPVSVKKQTFHITDEDGNTADFHIKQQDKNVLYTVDDTANVIDACIAAEIEEIIVVRGYLGEQFDQLLYKYPQIKFVENPDYNSSNNIVSMLYAREYLGACYVLEADLYLRNPKLIAKYQYSSNYLGIPVKRTDDWCMFLDGGYVSRIAHGGKGDNCYQTVGISYWTPEDGEKLREHVQEVCEEPGGRERLWGQIPLVVRHKDYKVTIRPCEFEDIVEIDTFAELKELDHAYAY